MDGYNPTKIQTLLDDFVRSGYIVAEIISDEPRKPSSIYSTVRAAIVRLNYTLTVKVQWSARDNTKVYLINKPKLKKYKEEYCEENKEE